MAKKQFLELGEKANSFYDAISKTQLSKGDVVEYTDEMKKSKRISRAIKAGHLVWTQEPVTKNLNHLQPTNKKIKDVGDEDVEDEDVEDEDEDEDTVESPYTKNELKSKNIQELKTICEDLDIEVEKGDTKKILIAKILG